MLNPDFTKNYIAAAYHNLMAMRMPVRALFKDAALARMCQEVPLDVLNVRVSFDPYLSGKKMAVTRVHSFESGNRVASRINPRVAQDAERSIGDGQDSILEQVQSRNPISCHFEE